MCLAMAHEHVPAVTKVGWSNGLDSAKQREELLATVGKASHTQPAAFPLLTRPSLRQRELRQAAPGLLTGEGPGFNRKELAKTLLLHGVCEATGNMLQGGRFVAVPGNLPLTVRAARALAKSRMCHVRFRFQISIA